MTVDNFSNVSVEVALGSVAIEVERFKRHFETLVNQISQEHQSQVERLRRTVEEYVDSQDLTFKKVLIQSQNSEDPPPDRRQPHASSHVQVPEKHVALELPSPCCEERGPPLASSTHKVVNSDRGEETDGTDPSESQTPPLLAEAVTDSRPRTTSRNHRDSMRSTVRFEDNEPFDLTSFDLSDPSSRQSGQTNRSRNTTRPGRRLSNFKSEANPKDATRAAYEQALTMVQPSGSPMMMWTTQLIEARRDYLRSNVRNFSCLQSFVHGKIFTSVSAAMILSNAVFIGIASDREVKVAIANTRHGTDETAPSTMSADTLFAVDVFFATAFTLELLLRTAVLRSHFWIGAEWRWNMLDVLVVAAALVELMVQGGDWEMNTSFIRVLRLIRMSRTVQVVRVYPAFSQLRLIMVAISDSMVSLLLAMTLLIFFMFVFGILFLQGVTDYVGDAEDEHAKTLVTYFNSMSMTMLTLGMTISGGINWWDIAQVFLDLSPTYAMILVLYQSLMILAMLNIVTGIFVNDAVEAAQSDRSLRVMNEIQHTSDFVRNLQDIFQEIDTDGDGSVTLLEFIHHINKPEFRAFFSTLGMDITDAVRFFSALDVEGDLQIEIDEFVAGCLALRRPNTAVDMETIKKQNRRIMKEIVALNEIAEEQLLALQAYMGTSSTHTEVDEIDM